MSHRHNDPRVSMLTAFVVLLAASPALADVQPHAGMMRYPDVSKDKIAFVYANDIWIAPHDGGMAVPLASPPGPELFPRFSPDGQTIAFVGNYDGNMDLYTMPVSGGTPFRVTHHPAQEVLCDWTPDGKLIFYYSGQAGLQRQMQLFTVPAEGGLPTRLPVPYGTNGAISPDGQWLAYTPHSTDFRTWKRYRGGMATDIWLINLSALSTQHSELSTSPAGISKRITDWEGTDTLPMWHGQTVYYLSDMGPEHRLNIWAYDTVSGKREQVTVFKDYDVKWPSIGPGPAGQGEIIFQKGPELLLLDLGTKATHAVTITVPGDRPRVRPQDVNAADHIQAWGISATGKRAVTSSRGDIWTLPAHEGSPRNLTRTNGIAERDPAWSPDSKWIAYFSDATGEYELYIAPADERGEARHLTDDGKTFRMMPTWSPDSKWITFADKTGALYLLNVETKAKKLIDTDPWANPPGVSWSHDSNWIAYVLHGDNRLTSIWLYDVANDQRHQVTSGMFRDNDPTFDRKGDFLYYTSCRHFDSPIYEDLGSTFVYTNTEMLLAVPLRKDVKDPFAAKSDEEPATTQPAETSTTKLAEPAASQPAKTPATGPAEPAASQPLTADVKGEPTSTSEPATSEPTSKPEEKKPLVIDLEGFEHRAIPLPLKNGPVGNLAVSHENKLIYVRGVPRGSEGEPSIKIFDMTDEKIEEKDREKTVLGGAGGFHISADGKKLLVFKDGREAIVDAAPDQNMDKSVSKDGMTSTIQPREEWKQVFNEAWRVERDWFYDPNMHGVDWAAVHDQYAKMLDDCASREDVGYVIAEMISEINVGHTYYYPGSTLEQAKTVPVGMLGADFEPADGAYRIARIIEGAPWDADARGPLSRPGVDIKEGDFLLAVNGVPVDAQKDPWAAFQGLADKTVTLTVSSHPTIDKDARDVVVKTLSSEADLRYRAWIERNRKYVADQTDGKVGYIYVPNTGVDGQNNLFRQFYGQVDRAALIIDERWNGGGQLPSRFIELLNRPVTNYWAVRNGHDWVCPSDSHQGPKCMLINGLAGSGGDMFPWLFKHDQLGKLIGTRTWGGLVGMSGNPGLIDGSAVTAPTFAFYETDGTWGIEGHGVDPDMMVLDDPGLMLSGGDPQLDAAIAHMQSEIERNGYRPPPRPPYPDRRGMGIREEDK